jgi:hypothetical protein
MMGSFNLLNQKGIFKEVKVAVELTAIRFCRNTNTSLNNFRAIAECLLFLVFNHNHCGLSRADNYPLIP